VIYWIVAFVLVVFVARTMLEVSFLKRGLLAYSAGKPTEALAWVRRAESLTLFGNVNPIAHQVKGLALSARGDVVGAAAAYEKSAERARATGQSATLGRSLVLLATIDRRRGDVARAESRAREAAALDPKCQRDALVCLLECATLRGAFDEARAHLEEAKKTTPLVSHDLERRSQALLSLSESWLEGEAGCYDAALRALDEASAGVTDHPKLLAFCRATKTWLRAATGEIDEAMREVKALDETRDALADDVDAQLCIVSLQARAATHARAFAEAKRYWEEYLALPLAKCFVPRAKVLLAECLAGLGDSSGARAALEEAAGFGADLLFARIARDRLANPACTP
jgi:tetratricopeptide (TPR) repeat protein